MSKSIVVRILAVLLLFASFAAQAAGLGNLHVLTALGQPLRAEIEVVGLGAGEADTLGVRLASSDAFRAAGLQFSPALVGLNLSIAQRDGKPIVLIASKNPVNEPFVEMLVELDWKGGQLVRAYTILLDPPTYIPPPPADAVHGPTERVVVAPKPEAPAPAAPAPAAPTPRAEPAMAPSDVEYKVEKGDTLSKIAREHMHSGVTFNQMMIALYRANPDAFIRENINLVRAGRILKVPSRDAVAAVDREDARDTVLAHMASFGEYRRQIAASAPSAPGVRGERTATGQITKPGAARPAGSEDRLKLSRAEPGKPGAGSSAAREDDRVARNRELTEAQSRVEELEKNISDLQKLLEIKNQQIAELEKRAGEAAKPAPVAPTKPEAAKPAPAKPEPKPEAKPEPKPEAKPEPKPEAKPEPKPEAKPEPKPEAKPEPKPVAKPKPEAKPEPTAKPKPRPTPPPPPPPSLVDEIIGDPKILGAVGAIILGLVGYGVYAWRRKKRAARSRLDEGLLEPVGAAAVAGAAGAEAAPAEAAAAPSDEVDPIAEADVYLAYGRDAQAEEILREALQANASRPGVHSKLLEIYAKRRDTKQFEATALKLKAVVGGEGPEWDRAMALGRSVDPGNGLYGQGDAAAVAPAAQAAEAPAPAAVDFDLDATAGFELPKDETPAEPEPQAAAPTLDFDLGGTTTEEPAAVEAAAPTEEEKAPDAGGLDFDLGGTTTEAPATEESAAKAPAAADADAGLDFELNLDTTGETQAVPTAQEAPAGGPDLGTISLDLGGDEAPATPAGGGDAKWQEVATKLDLAKAYEEMGDKDGARELLNEVIKEGDAAQQAQAQQMLAGLG